MRRPVGHVRLAPLLRWGSALGIVLFGVVAVGPSASASSTSGPVPGTSCTYSLSAKPDNAGDYSSGALSGSLTCGSTASLTVQATWGADGTPTDVAITAVTGKLFGQQISSPPALPWQFTLPDDPTNDLTNFIYDFSSNALQQAQDNLLKSPLTVGPKPFLGGACSYKVQATWDGSDWTSGTLTGTIACGSKSPLTASVSLSASWSDDGVSLGSLTGTFAGQDINDALDSTINVLDDPGSDLGDMLDDVATGIAGQLTNYATSNGLSSALNSVSQVASGDMPGSVLQALDNFCAPVLDPAGPSAPPPHTPRPPMPPTPATADCGNKVGDNPDPAGSTETKMGPDSQEYRDADGGGSSDDSESANDVDEDGACPELANSSPPDMFVICVPVLLAGDFNVGKKSIVLIPGGAIVAVPVGSSLSAATTPSIETSGSILSWGSAIAGVNLKMSAKTIELAGTDVSMLGSLQLNASQQFSLGQVNLKQALGFVPGLLSAPG
ncbi:MAG TPA: hypothetical protein VK425_02455, partial [Acidimicrobiales bacterium]|nr:hypothetical protein [Acidimicrobiales bacterium]